MHRVRAELIREALLGEPRAREDEEAARLLIEPVHDAERRPRALVVAERARATRARSRRACSRSRPPSKGTVLTPRACRRRRPACRRRQSRPRGDPAGPGRARRVLASVTRAPARTRFSPSVSTRPSPPPCRSQSSSARFPTSPRRARAPPFEGPSREVPRHYALSASIGAKHTLCALDMRRASPRIARHLPRSWTPWPRPCSPSTTAPRCAKFSRSPSAAKTSRHHGRRVTGRAREARRNARRVRHRYRRSATDDGYALAKEIRSRTRRRDRAPRQPLRAVRRGQGERRGRGRLRRQAVRHAADHRQASQGGPREGGRAAAAAAPAPKAAPSAAAVPVAAAAAPQSTAAGFGSGARRRSFWANRAEPHPAPRPPSRSRQGPRRRSAPSRAPRRPGSKNRSARRRFLLLR